MHSFRRPYNFRSTGRTGSWYEIKNISAETASLSIYDEIGMWGVTAAAFAQDLGGVTAQNLDIHINSPGGDVFDGLAILNALRQHPAKKSVTVDGLAASAASFIAMAGDTIKMAPQSMMMIHDAQGLAVGDARTMRDLADLLDKNSENIANVYAQRTGKPAEEWRNAMLAETWYTDQEAVDAGLADGIVGSEQTPEPVAVAARVTDPWGNIDFDTLSKSLASALKGE